eukprot:m.6005 g.6005  ORF g.6005 m.6005 type:complete len:741 (-) comp5116_c0_seq2:435-2657(-)
MATLAGAADPAPDESSDVLDVFESTAMTSGGSINVDAQDMVGVGTREARIAMPHRGAASPAGRGTSAASAASRGHRSQSSGWGSNDEDETDTMSGLGYDEESESDTQPLLFPNSREHKRLTHIQRMTTSPFTKYTKYKRFPFKFSMTILLLISVTCMFVVRNIQYSNFIANTSDSIRYLLGNQGESDELTGITYLYSVDQVTEHMQTAVSNYLTFKTMSPSKVEVSSSVNMTLDSIHNTEHAVATADAPLGPFTNVSLAKVAAVFHTLQQITLYFTFENQQLRSYGAGLMDVNYTWQCQGIYDFSVTGGRVQFEVQVSSGIADSSSYLLVIINSLVILFALPSLILTTKSLIKSYHAFAYAKANLSTSRTSPKDIIWADLSLSDKLAFFNMWHVTSSVADLMLIVGGCTNFSRQLGYRKDDHAALSVTDVLQGLGAFFAWISLLKYFEWNVELYMLILAVKASIGRVLKFIVTVAPVYIAFMVLGVAFFYDHEDLFGDFFKSSATIFALLNGDSILLVFQELQTHANGGYKLMAHIYVYAFGVVGITIVLNVFIFIIESGYDAAITAVYGYDDELSVFIDHRRLKEILTAATQRDPHSNPQRASRSIQTALEDVETPSIKTPTRRNFKRLSRRHSRRNLQQARAEQEAGTGSMAGRVTFDSDGMVRDDEVFDEERRPATLPDPLATPPVPPRRTRTRMRSVSFVTEQVDRRTQLWKKVNELQMELGKCFQELRQLDSSPQ